MRGQNREPNSARCLIGLVAAERDAVGIVGEEFAHHLEAILRSVLRDQPVKQHVVGGKGVGLGSP